MIFMISNCNILFHYTRYYTIHNTQLGYDAYKIDNQPTHLYQRISSRLFLRFLQQEVHSR